MLSFFTLKLPEEAKKIEIFQKFQRWMEKTNIFMCKPPEVHFTIRNHIINYLLTELARAVPGNIGPQSFLYGPRCARSVLSRPRANIPQYGPRARLVRGYYYYYYYHFGGHWGNKHWKNDNKTLWRIFFSPARWEKVSKLWNGFSILIGCIDHTIIWFSLFIGLFQRAKIHFSPPNSSF